MTNEYLTSLWKSYFDEKRENTGISSDLKEVIQNENLKDFTIKVGDEEFKVHKLLLAARSPVLKEMIENNIDAECLKLVDVPKEIFREILNFMYTDELSESNNINYLHLFIAAGRLKIEILKNFAAENLVDEVNVVNALEILTLANKYGNDILRQKSLRIIKDELKEVFDDIPRNMAMNAEELKKILSIKNGESRHSSLVLFGLACTFLLLFLIISLTLSSVIFYLILSLFSAIYICIELSANKK